jgi:hypothetical protein
MKTNDDCQLMTLKHAVVAVTESPTWTGSPIAHVSSKENLAHASQMTETEKSDLRWCEDEVVLIAAQRIATTCTAA